MGGQVQWDLLVLMDQEERWEISDLLAFMENLEDRAPLERMA